MNAQQLQDVKPGSVVSYEDMANPPSTAVVVEAGVGWNGSEFELLHECGRTSRSDLRQFGWRLHPPLPEGGIDRQCFAILKELHDGTALPDARSIATRLLRRDDVAWCEAAKLLARVLDGEDTENLRLATEALIERESLA